MKQQNQEKRSFQTDLWVISKGVFKTLENPPEHTDGDRAIEYRLSEIGHYLLNPNPIQVDKMLVGCKVHFIQPRMAVFQRGLRNLMPWTKAKSPPVKIPPQNIMAHDNYQMAKLNDSDLENHFDKLQEWLKPYDTTYQQLSALDLSKVYDLEGVIEDTGHYQSTLVLKGSLKEKMNYVKNFLGKQVVVCFDKSYLSHGLFEMKGFNFNTYDPDKVYFLVKCRKEGQPAAYVTDVQGKLLFWIKRMDHITKLQLLDHCMKTNPRFNKSLDLCREGKAEPLKLLFSNKFEINYYKTHLPKLFKDLLRKHSLKSDEKEIIMNSLNQSQIGISFYYSLKSESSEKTMLSNISVLHDLKALEAWKQNFPQLYSEISKKAFVSEDGKFYLLDFLKGSTNV